MIYSFLQNADTAVTVQFENKISREVNSYVTRLADLLNKNNIAGVTELIPAFASLTVIYDCTVISARTLKKKLARLIKNISSDCGGKARMWEIPVCYDGEFAPDMDNVCAHTGLDRDEVIKLHTSKPYLIYMLGFLPGFAYLGGMDERLFTPRLETPRLEIFEGAVGIGGEQTGIYPIASPGGWQLIGKTPVKVYDKDREDPILYRAGDYVKFYSIDINEFEKIRLGVQNGEYQPRCSEITV